MAMAGETLDYLVRNVWYPEAVRAYFSNNWLFSQNYFRIQPALPGDVISTTYEYARTTNATTMAYDDAMVTPGNASFIRAYFNKQSFQNSARIFLQKLNYRSGGGYETDVNYAQQTVNDAVREMRDLMVTTILAQLVAQIDATSNYSDAALARGTYTQLTSYEESTSTALTLVHLEDMIEAILTRTQYGTAVTDVSELVLLCSQNQVTNISRLGGAAAYNATFNITAINAQDMGPMDLGRVMRTKTFEGIDIVPVPDMSTTDILLCHKPNVILHETEPMSIEGKPEAAHTRLWKIVAGYNIEARNPNNHAKLSAKTA